MKTNRKMELGILTELANVHEVTNQDKNLVKLEFEFYTDLDLKGEDLLEDLKKLNYEGEVDATHRKCDCTRVYGTTTLIRNEEEILKKWWVELRDVGNYHGCDLIFYSVIRNPALSINEITQTQQVVSEQMYEERKSAQVESLSLYMELREMHGAGTDTTQLDFFFYANDRQNADALAEDLRKLNYKVQVGDGTGRNLPFSITGQTPPVSDDEATMVLWVNQMNELGFIHNAEFDGWGSACGDSNGCKGGWFSDDATDEEIRARLGLPPRED